MIEVTEAAADKIKNILIDEGDPNLKLRIYVEGGGCSGFQYGFKLVDIGDSDDLTFESNGVILLIDAISAQYLEGATLDFKKKLFGSEFVLKNPRAKVACGCGKSFSA
jgi:iron-sulfur cluster insertion protein